jgi:hypothetical protein
MRSALQRLGAEGKGGSRRSKSKVLQKDKDDEPALFPSEHDPLTKTLFDYISVIGR